MISDYLIKSPRKLIEVALPLEAARNCYTDFQKLAGNRAVAAGIAPNPTTIFMTRQKVFEEVFSCVTDKLYGFVAESRTSDQGAFYRYSASLAKSNGTTL